MSQAEDKLKEVLTSLVEEKFPQASGLKITPISTQGANYTSTLFVATINTPKENVELFAKVITMGENFSEASSSICDTENFIYTTVFNVFEELQDKHGIVDQRFVFPKFYESNATIREIVVLENLASKGYACLDRFKYIDWKYASKCIETLAKFHALSFAMRKEYPEIFKKAEVLKLPDATGAQWDGVTDAALAAVDEEDREKLSQLLGKSEGFDKLTELGVPLKTSVIIHGDYRPSNLLHKEVDDGYHIIPVDYQTARYGCPAADLIYYIVMSSDQQFRQQHYHQLVDHYYEQLALAMTSLGLEPEHEYGRKEFESDMKEKLPFGLCAAAMGLPFLTVAPDDAPSFEQGQFIPRSNKLFVERFRALVSDFKQWGFI